MSAMTIKRDDVWVVTGAGSGIGRATALAAARQGARIAAIDVSEQRLDSLQAELGDRALLLRVVDVSDRVAMRAFADAVHALVPAADVIVNNAGVAIGGAFLETSLDDWDWILGINLKGVVHGCHFFVPRMVDRKRGHVINIASIFGIFAPPGVSAYCASKFGVLGMTQSLRVELAPHGIGTTAICPGMINTAIVADGKMAGGLARSQSKIVERFKKGAPPEAVAAAILEAVRTNPAVRTVGKDAWALHQASRFLPAAAYKLGAAISKRVA